MTPPLPSELLSEIITFACADEDPTACQQLRNRFRLVCKTWRDSFDYWREVYVVGRRKLVVVIPTRRSDRRSAKVDHVGIILIRQLLKSVNRVERLSLTAGSTVIGHSTVTRRVVHPLLVEPLSSLTHLTQLELDAMVEPGRGLFLLASDLDLLLSRWSRLVHIQLVDVPLIGAGDQTDRVFFRKSASLRFVRVNGYDSAADLKALIASLPLSVSALTLCDCPNYQMPSFIEVIRTAVPTIAESLQDLRILDACEGHHVQAPQIQRGVYADLIARLTSLRRLTISPCAVANLTTTLARLPHLVELSLIQGKALPQAPVTKGEVIVFLSRSTSLRGLMLCRETCRGWIREDFEAVEQAAEVKGVEMVWLGE